MGWKRFELVRTQIWSYSFLELGTQNLKKQCAWITPMVLLSKDQRKLKGGCSAVTAAFLEHALLSERNGFATAGCPLPFDDGPVLLHASRNICWVPREVFFGAFFVGLWVVRFPLFDLPRVGGWCARPCTEAAPKVSRIPFCWKSLGVRLSGRGGCSLSRPQGF